MASHPLLRIDRWKRPHARSRALDTCLSAEERTELERDLALRADLEQLLVDVQATRPDIDALLFFYRGDDGTLAGFVELCADLRGRFHWNRYQRAGVWCERAVVRAESQGGP